MDCPGIIAKCVDDVITIFNLVMGYDKKDSTSLNKDFKRIRLPPGNKMSIKGLKVGIPVEYYNEHLNNDVLEIWNETAQVLADGGATVREVIVT